eukprot:m.121167 g.121167  ORF g.121167 m.121167 type:complete len:131 (-) comp15518_c0_seq9:89-481(-)
MSLHNAKMSKSLGNTISIKDFLAQHNQNHLRMLCLQSRYRSTIAFSQDDVAAAAKFYQRFANFFQESQNFAASDLSIKALRPTMACTQLVTGLLDAERRFHDALCDDFNTPEAVKVSRGSQGVLSHLRCR